MASALRWAAAVAGFSGKGAEEAGEEAVEVNVKGFLVRYDGHGSGVTIFCLWYSDFILIRTWSHAIHGSHDVRECILILFGPNLLDGHVFNTTLKLSPYSLLKANSQTLVCTSCGESIQRSYSLIYIFDLLVSQKNSLFWNKATLCHSKHGDLWSKRVQALHDVPKGEPPVNNL